MDNLSKGDTCIFSRDSIASGNSGAGQRRKGRSSSPASYSKVKQTDGEGQKTSKESGNKEESSSDKRSEIPCRFKFCKNPSCKFCFKSEKDENMVTNAISDMLRQRRNPAKSKKGGAKDQLRC